MTKSITTLKGEHSALLDLMNFEAEDHQDQVWQLYKVLITKEIQDYENTGINTDYDLYNPHWAAMHDAIKLVKHFHQDMDDLRDLNNSYRKKAENLRTEIYKLERDQ